MDSRRWERKQVTSARGGRPSVTGVPLASGRTGGWVRWLLPLALAGLVSPGCDTAASEARAGPTLQEPASPAPAGPRADPWANPFGIFYVGRQNEVFAGSGAAFRIFLPQATWEEAGAPRTLDEAVLRGNVDGLLVTLQLHVDAQRREGVESIGYHRYCLPEGAALERSLRFVRDVVERYDGDADPGCRSTAGPDCYAPGDGMFPADPGGLAARPIHRWQVENEFFAFCLDCSRHRAGEPVSAEKAASYLTAVSRTIRAADPAATVVFPALTGFEAVLLERGFLDAMDLGTTDCDRRVLTRAEVDAHPRAFAERRAEVAAVRARFEDTLTGTAGAFDAIDFHTYNNDYHLSEAVVAWVRSLGLDADVVSTEMSGPYFMYAALGAPTPRRCAREGRDDRGPLRYSDAVLSSYVVKTFVVGLAAGVRRMHWATGEELFEPYLDNYQRLGLVEKDGRRKPAFHAFQDLIGTLAGFTRVTHLEGDVYVFHFDGGPPVAVGWQDGGRRTVDLGSVFSGEVTAAPVVTVLDPAGQPVRSPPRVGPATAVELGDVPVFVR